MFAMHLKYYVALLSAVQTAEKCYFLFSFGELILKLASKGQLCTLNLTTKYKL